MSNPQMKNRKRGIGLVCLVLVIGGVWAYRHHAAAHKPPAAGPPPVPVVTGRVAQKDVPIYLDGLGTVQAFNAVTVRVRVDGELKKVAFTEGQDVKAGDVLAQIDSDPFRAQLEQVEAKKAQDEAQLANARIELERDKNA